jgi:hypothetical protein
MFLTAEEIKRLTGASWRRLQVERLRKEGFALTFDRRGRPLVLASEVQRKLRSRDAPAGWEPNIEAING